MNTTLLAASAASLLIVAAAHADVANVIASADNTIASDAQSNSNGGSDGIFAGTSRSGGIRRGLVMFDLAGALPVGATLTGVALEMNLVQGQGTHTITLHRSLAAWGEGIAPGSGGQGTAADPGDATWTSNFFGASTWAVAGGDFGAASASTSVNALATGLYSWSSAAMLADVQAWLANPTSNFGWFILGNEGATQTAMRFASREHTEESMRPRLVLTYVIPAPGAGGLALFAGLAASRRRRR